MAAFKSEVDGDVEIYAISQPEKRAEYADKIIEMDK